MGILASREVAITMTEPNHAPHHQNREFLLPEVSEEVVQIFRHNPLGFEVLYAQLRETNPRLAEYVRDRAEQLAPGDIHSKEILARLALETHGIIAAQAEVSAMEALLQESASNSVSASGDDVSDLPPVA